MRVGGIYASLGIVNRISWWLVTKEDERTLVTGAKSNQHVWAQILTEERDSP